MGCLIKKDGRVPVGEMDKRVKLLSQTSTKNTLTNEEILVFAEVGTVWAKVERAGRFSTKVTDQEKFILSKEVAVIQYVVTIRYNEAMENFKNRIEYNGTQYDVEGVAEIGRKDQMQLLVVDIV